MKFSLVQWSILLEALKDNHTVTSIDFTSGNVEDKGAIALVEALKVNHTITSFNIIEANSPGTRDSIAEIEKSVNRNKVLVQEVSTAFKNIITKKDEGLQPTLKVNASKEDVKQFIFLINILKNIPGMVSCILNDPVISKKYTKEELLSCMEIIKKHYVSLYNRNPTEF